VDRADRDRAAEPRDRSGDRVVDRQPCVDAADAVDEGDALAAVVVPVERRPVDALDGVVDGALRRRELGRVERCAVLRRPALDEDPRHTGRILRPAPDTFG